MRGVTNGIYNFAHMTIIYVYNGLIPTVMVCLHKRGQIVCEDTICDD